MEEIRIRGYALRRKQVLSFAAAFALWILGFVFINLKTTAEFSAMGNLMPSRFLPLLPFIAAWLLAGLPVLKSAAKNLVKGRGMDENFLMTAATVGAFAIGAWEEAAGVMIFYMIGELIQEAAINKSRSSIDALLALKPDKARVRDGDGWKEVDPADVAPGNLVLVRPGERIPLDGIIMEGKSDIDASMLTGESRPVLCAEGDEVRSGTIPLNGALRIKTIRSSGDSSAARIIQLVQSAREAKAKPERFITAFARWYTPAVVGCAVLLAVLPPLFVPGARFTDWFYRSLILLVISCPCALVVSVPMGYFAGIGGMSRRGIMVKGSVHLDSLYRAKNVAFDKTGTLTKGKFSIAALEPAPGISGQLLLETAALAERESNHPIARAILEYVEIVERGIRNAEYKTEAFSVREIAGQGLEVLAGGEMILAGTRRFLVSRGVSPNETGAAGEETEAATPVYIARNARYLGCILVGDTLKEGAVEAVNRLREMGIRNTMFTGDTRSSALGIASRLGISSVEAELLPEDKLRALEKLTRSGATIFVGDGINDAPVLTRAHVGIAMGSGADVAVEAADVIVMTGDPRRIPEAIERARKIHRIVMGNVVFALTAKGFFIVLAGMGLANMWMALIADVGVALLAILNSARALR